MKILWITNILLPDICDFLGLKKPVVGGWMNSSLISIRNIDNSNCFAVASLYEGRILLEKELNGVTYFCIPIKGGQAPIKYDSSLEKYWVEIYKRFQPDIVHIHGSEYQHGLAYVKACGNQNVVLSIQGCISAISRYALGGIEYEDWNKNYSFHDLLKGVNQRKQIINNFDIRSKGEIEFILLLKHIIGRTSWDRAHAYAINPKIQYFFCNETLRPAFYKSKWDANNCVKHRIFLSQASTPIKGLHQMIRALPYILRHFPDSEVYIAGTSPIHLDWKRRSTLGNFLLSLLNKTGLEDKFHFTGPLDEQAMVNMYLSSHIFVCPSYIENSPNSLGEAQLLGVPSVASFVGGIPDMIEDGNTGLIYRAEEYEMMAEMICRIFEDFNFAKSLSESAKKVAIDRHDRKINALQLINIYRNIMEQ